MPSASPQQARSVIEAGRRKLMPNLEQVTCSEPTVTPINSAISSRLFPRSTRVLICWILAGVNVCREAKRLWLCAPITQSSLCPPRVPAPTMSIACSPLVCLLRCGPFNPNTHVSVKMVSSRTENLPILFRDAPMPNCLSKSSRSQDDHSVANGQCRCENVATIDGRKSIPQSRPRRQIPKRHRGHQNAGSTMPPDRSRHPISRISSADVAAVSKQVHLALFYDCNLDIGAMD